MKLENNAAAENKRTAFTLSPQATRFGVADEKRMKLNFVLLAQGDQVQAEPPTGPSNDSPGGHWFGDRETADMV